MRVKGGLSLLLLLFLILSSGLGEDTVAEDLGVHQLDRLVELLTTAECEHLLGALSHPEENIFQQLERLSPENNQLDLQPRVRRDTDEIQCRAALTDWLLKHGEQTYYDRLARALQHIGRTDIAIEVAKNINQDKSLSMKRYVDDYHKRVSTLDSHVAQSETKNHHRDQPSHTRTVRDLRWSDLELVVERAPVPPYQRRPLDGAWPLLYGFLLGFGGAWLVVVLFVLFVNRIDQRDITRETASRETGGRCGSSGDGC